MPRPCRHLQASQEHTWQSSNCSRLKNYECKKDKIKAAVYSYVNSLLWHRKTKYHEISMLIGDWWWMRGLPCKCSRLLFRLLLCCQKWPLRHHLILCSDQSAVWFCESITLAVLTVSPCVEPVYIAYTKSSIRYGHFVVSAVKWVCCFFLIYVHLLVLCKCSFYRFICIYTGWAKKTAPNFSCNNFW